MFLFFKAIPIRALSNASSINVTPSFSKHGSQLLSNMALTREKAIKRVGVYTAIRLNEASDYVLFFGTVRSAGLI